MLTLKPKRVWTAEEVKGLLLTNDKVLYRALMILYSKQTDGEKLASETHVVNGEGFNKFDADFMSSAARWLDAHRYLTDAQKRVVRKKITKYVKQLVAVANS